MSDFEQIHSLLAAYCHVTDRGTAEDIATFYWDDARLVFNDEFNGRAEIEASYEDWIKNMRDPVENLRHLIYSPYVEIEGDAARAVCYFDADGTSRKKGTPIFLKGEYQDHLQKRDGAWKLAERRIIVY